jgi:hypothetical protein
LWQSSPLLEEVRETDPDGRIVLHHRIVNTFGRMLKAGTITEPMLDAWRQFQRQFILAQLDPLRAPDMAGIPGNGCEADPGDIGLAAREQVHHVLRALGGHDGLWAQQSGTCWVLAARSGSGRCGRAGTADSCARSRRRGC